MFEKLLSQIKEPALQIIKEQAIIPSEKSELAANDAIASISEEIDAMMESGDFSGLAGIKNEENVGSNIALQKIIVSFSDKLQSNIGVENSAANHVSNIVIPQLFISMKEKFSSEKMDLKSLMSSLSLPDMMKLMANMGKLKEAFGK